MERNEKSFEKLNQTFLRDWPEKLKEHLSLHTSYRKFKKNNFLFREGREVDAIYVIVRGKVKLVRFDLEGRENVLGIFGADEAIWESILLESTSFPYSCLSITDAAVLKIDKNAFIEALSSEPDVALKIIALLSRKLHDANERNMMLSARTPMGRVAAFLIYRQKRDGGTDVEFSLNDISASTNMRPETASRKITELADMGVIERSGKSTIRILNYEGLEAFLQ